MGFGEQGMFRHNVFEGIRQGNCQVGLDTEGVGAAIRPQGISHDLPHSFAPHSAVSIFASSGIPPDVSLGFSFEQ
jgi:hypothetical protein